MPIKRIVKKSQKKSLKKSSKISKEKLQLSLPDEAEDVPENLGAYVNLIYGAKKIGKTSLCAQFPNCFGLLYENVAKSIKFMKRQVPDHEHALGYLDLLESEPEKYDTVLIDTLKKCADRSFKAACQKLMITHPGEENDFGASWGKVRVEFEEFMARFVSLDCGLILTAHEADKEIKTRTGDKFNMIVPDLSSQAQEWVKSDVDNVWYYHFRGNRRFLQIRGTDYVTANCAFDKNFLTPEGLQIEAVPLGTSASEAYSNLVSAFNNNQTETYSSDTEEVKKPTRKKKILKRRK